MPTTEPLRVLFVCTGNAARSQMAEAILRQLTGGRVAVFSAGSVPKKTLHPLTLITLEQTLHIAPSSLRPKSLDEFTGQVFDYVITVCDDAAETCPVFPGAGERLHWSFEDPAAIADEESARRAFAQVATELSARLRFWLASPTVSARLA